MKVLKIVGGVIGLVVVAFVGGGFLLPDAVHMERAAEVDAPACNVHALARQVSRFNEYSAWKAMDPTSVTKLEGPAAGVGGTMSWVGEKTGTGSMVLTKDEPCKRVDFELDFGSNGKAKAYWTFEAKGDKTQVVYGFDGNAEGSLVGRYFNLGMDAMMGPAYDDTLAGLKRIAEAGPKLDVAGVDVVLSEEAARSIAYVDLKTSADPVAIGEALGPAFGQVGTALGAAGITPTGMPIVVTTAATADGFELQAALPVDRIPEPPPADPAVKFGTTTPGRTAKLVHKGSYADLDATHAKAAAWLAIHKLEQSAPSWEEFANDPGNTPEAELLTNIFIPVKDVP